MKNNDLFQRYYHELLCQIYVVGHSTQGECIIVTLHGDQSIIYSCVVDSFVFDDKIVPKELLHEMGIEHITDLFWTHPHDDHSNGILELIADFGPKNVYIPSELQTLPQNCTSISTQVLTTLNTYRTYDRRSPHQPKIQSIATNTTLYDDAFRVGPYKIPFNMFTIAPCSGKVRQNSINEHFSSLNDYSIVVSLNIGDFSLLLTGDVQNRMIAYAADDLFRTVPTPNILKIPHHGSKESLDIVDLFDDDSPVDIAITTAKRTSGLPRDEALQFYNSHCRNLLRINPDSKELAIWGAEIDVVRASITQIVNKNF